MVLFDCPVPKMGRMEEVRWMLPMGMFVLFGAVLLAFYLLNGTGNSFVVDAPPIVGHLKPLGAHQPPIAQGIERWKNAFQLPYASHFYGEYVAKGKPVVFESIAKHIPAYHKWSDEYMSLEFGNLTMTVETKKKEDRKGSIEDMKLTDFLRRYESEELYLVGSVPYEMLSDFHLPRSLLCEGFLKVLSDVVMWLSSGETNSVLHYDELDNINCLLEGEKEFFLIDKAHAGQVEIGDLQGGYSDVDVDKVDMYKYPGLRNVPWYNVTLSKGDCIFIPYRWLHQVRSSKGRNLALNIWFVHLYWLDAVKCETDNLPLTTSFADMDFCQAKECLRAELVGYTNGTEELNILSFKRIFGKYLGSDHSLQDAFRVVDENEDGILNLQELYEMDADVMLGLFPKFGRKE